jgi:hypothetical protein
MNVHNRIGKMIQEETRATGVIQVNVGQQDVSELSTRDPILRERLKEALKRGRWARIDNRWLNAIHDVAADRTREIEMLEVDTDVIVHTHSIGSTKRGVRIADAPSFQTMPLRRQSGFSRDHRSERNCARPSQ